jgi:glycosyltransferase involved in cell wall biosynthesis
MRIVHLDLERGWRGGERQVLLLARELSAGGVGQVLIARSGGALAGRALGLPGLEVRPVGSPAGAVREILGIGPPAVIHAHTGNTVPMAVLGRARGLASLATRRLDLPASSFWLNRVDRVAAISPSVEASLLRAGVAPSRIVLIPSGIDRTRVADPSMRAALRGRLSIPAEAVVGLTVAALEPQKDPLTLASALPALPREYHHVWVGGGALSAEAARLASRSPDGGRLHLVSFDPEPDKWFAAADIFVLPSRHEGLGTVILDAFHFGLPVVSADIPGPAGLAEEGVTALLFPPGDAAALALAIRRLIGEPALAARLREAGTARVAGFDIAGTAAAYLDLYGRILRERPGKPRRH